MIRIGETVPNIELRTDEGTPLSLTDLKGRALVVFLLGESFNPTSEQLLSLLSENIGRFLALDSSPIAVLGESPEKLAEYREIHDLPFMFISDPAFKLHRKLKGDNLLELGVCVVGSDSVVTETLPSLPPTELVRLAIERMSRMRRGKENQNGS